MGEREGFIPYLQTEKRYSDHTIQAYKSDLEKFEKFLQQEFDLNSVNKADHQMVRSWTMSMMDQGMSARTVNRKLSTLKSYYKFLLREGIINDNPMSKVISPKTKSRLPNYVEEGDMNDLLAGEYFEPDFNGVRNRLIFLLFYYTGMRRSELIGIKLQDFNPNEGTLKVLGKGNKERIIPINNELIDIVNDYMKLRREINSDNTSLLITEKGQTIYPKLVYRVVKEHLSKVSTAEKRSPHVLRHTFATHMLNNGADLNTIKEILGHANLSATQIYTHNSIEKLKQIYNQAHPKA